MLTLRENASNKKGRETTKVSKDSKSRCKCVNVLDAKSSVKLLSQLITDYQKGKTDTEKSKNLAYLTQTIMSAYKALTEQEEIICQLELLETRLDMELTNYLDALFEELALKLNENEIAKALEIIVTKKRDFKIKIKDTQREFIKKVNKRKHFSISEKDKTDVDLLVLKIINGLELLPQEGIDEVVSFMKEKKLIY